MSGFNSIELFTGAGGLALGLESAGWHHMALVECDKHACATVEKNRRLVGGVTSNWTLVKGDVRNVHFSSLFSDIDLVAGGPPCQPFSLGGKHRAFNDDRDMFPEAVRAVRELAPRFFVFENVKGLLRESFASYFNYIILQLSYPEVIRDKSQTWQEHLADLERLHTGGASKGLCYRVIYRLLNAAEYGVPQNRHRVFIVGFRGDLKKEWSFPPPTHSFERLLWDQHCSGEYWEKHRIPKGERPPIPGKYARKIEKLRTDFRLFPPSGLACRTVRDALSGLPDPIRGQSGPIPNHEFRDGAKTYPGHTGSPLDEPSKTLKAGAHGVPGGENMLIYPDGRLRYYTAREAARLQTFPDEYIFTGGWSESMRQIGNAVPVKLAEIVGNSIYRQAT